MEDYGFNFVRIIMGLLLSAAMVLVFFIYVLQNYIQFDLTGHTMVQTRSGVYDRGLTLAEVTGENLQGRIITPMHVVMFPTVDSHIIFESVNANTRHLRIYEQMKLRHGTDIPFAGGTIWDRRYWTDRASMTNRAATFRSFNDPMFAGNGLLYWPTLAGLAREPGDTVAQSLAHPRGGWFGVVNGAHNGTSDWMLFQVEQADRLLIPLDPATASPPVGDIVIFE